jgi:type IV pilus assembly protein PilA
MKKNGFTLIEILAVIAVIAVLAILIVPNVLEMVDKSKRNLFVAQAKNIYNEAIQEYTLAIEEYVEKNRFYYDGVTEENKLNLSGSKNIFYDIEIYSDKVTKFIVSDANYSINLNGTDIKLKDIVLN